MKIEELLAPSISVVINEMTDQELTSICFAVQLDQDPRQMNGYNKALTLFTEDDETRMHQVTKTVFLALAFNKLGL